MVGFFLDNISIYYSGSPGPAGTTNCSDVTGYSDTASVSTALNLNLSAYANGEMLLKSSY